jgi:hyperosmotically inducible protein
MKFVCFIISCMFLASCSNNNEPNPCCVGQRGQQSNQSSDWQITTKVKTSIMGDGSLSASSRLVSITTNNGVVTISGTVASKDDMNRIVRLAKDVDGVRKVDNQMSVSGS